MYFCEAKTKKQKIIIFSLFIASNIVVEIENAAESNEKKIF